MQTPTRKSGITGNSTRWAIRAVLAVTLLALSVPAFAEKPAAIEVYNQGIDAYSQGNTTRALSLFERATAIDPGYSDAFYNMGSIYYQKGMYDKAEGVFRKVVNLNPTDGQAKYNLAMAIEKQGRIKEAIRFYDQVPNTDKKYPMASKKVQQLQQQLAAAEMGRNSQPSGYNNSPYNTLSPRSGDGMRPIVPKDQGQRADVLDKVTAKPFSKGFAGPTGMTIGPEGYLFVANYTQNTIDKVGANGDKAVFAKSTNLGGPIGMTFNPKTQELYVANYIKGNVVRVSPRGDVTVLASGLGKPYNLFLDTYNNVLYVGEQQTNSVSKIDLP